MPTTKTKVTTTEELEALVRDADVMTRHELEMVARAVATRRPLHWRLAGKLLSHVATVGHAGGVS